MLEITLRTEKDDTVERIKSLRRQRMYMVVRSSRALQAAMRWNGISLRNGDASPGTGSSMKLSRRGLFCVAGLGTMVLWG